MKYDRSDSFPFGFEPNEILFVSKPKRKLSPRSYSIQCERKWKYSFLSVQFNGQFISEDDLSGLNLDQSISSMQFLSEI